MATPHTTILRTALVLAVLGATAQPARADWLLSPFVGMNFGGNASFGDVGDFEDNLEKKAVFGGAFTWMGGGIFGVEADFGFAPNFFENTSGDSDFEFGDSNLTTLMGNAVFGIPVGGTKGPGVRPYGSAGLGLIRSSIDGNELFDDVSASDLGVNIGGGAHVFFNDRIGLRGDIRYFRSLQDNEPDDNLDLELSDFDFWRVTVGVTFRVGG